VEGRETGEMLAWTLEDEKHTLTVVDICQRYKTTHSQQGAGRGCSGGLRLMVGLMLVITDDWGVEEHYCFEVVITSSE
jgi:hypothetical protein